MSLIFESNKILNDNQSKRLFNYVLIISQVFGVSALLSVVFWMGNYEDEGYSWSTDPDKQFHYHPTLMGMGPIFLYGEAILVYRVFRNEEKRFSKLLHVVIHTLTMTFAIVALKAVWDSHDYHKNAKGELDLLPNLYSIHSWIGILFFTSYVLQYLAGFITFFFPGLSMDFRKFFLPFHQLFGVIIFIGFSTAALMGITEKSAWKHTCWTVKKTFCTQQFLANFFGISLLGYCFSVLFLVMNPRWKRLPLPQEVPFHPVSSPLSSD